MYFIATNQGHKYQNRDLESFRVSWNKSKEAVETFLVKIENVTSIKSDDILMTYELEQIGTMLKKENNNELEALVQQILTTISQISMTSKFNLAKKPSVEPMNDSQKPGLFKALEICRKHVVDVNLKQLFQKLVEAYGQESVVKNAEKIGRQIDIILMDVNGELYDMITEFIDGNESTKTDLTKSIDIFADKFADEMRNKKSFHEHFAKNLLNFKWLKTAN
uniref:Uncharacterized protein n=1 Tax=Panagrolaimus superbus TaxID=310955 RepID=A0A914XV66_9BILA